jgi:hypothetical protein
LQCRHADFARADEKDAHAGLRRQLMNCRGSAPTPPGHRLRHQFFAGSDFTPAHRRCAAGAQIIVNFPVWKD